MDRGFLVQVPESEIESEKRRNKILVLFGGYSGNCVLGLYLLSTFLFSGSQLGWFWISNWIAAFGMSLVMYRRLSRTVGIVLIVVTVLLSVVVAGFVMFIAWFMAACC